MSYVTEAASERTLRKVRKEEERKLTEQSEHSKRIFRNTLQGQSAWERHQQYVRRYLQAYGDSSHNLVHQTSGRNDWDVLKEQHRFLRDDDEETEMQATYDDEVAKKYYRALFKDLVLADLKHYKSGNVAFRWRSEEDVIDGIGQFSQ